MIHTMFKNKEKYLFTNFREGGGQFGKFPIF